MTLTTKGNAAEDSVAGGGKLLELNLKSGSKVCHLKGSMYILLQLKAVNVLDWSGESSKLSSV